MKVYAPRTSEFIVDDGAEHVVHADTMAGVRHAFYSVSPAGGQKVLRWSDVEKCYVLDEELTNQLFDAKWERAQPGRPKTRSGDYERISLEVRKDLLEKIDASGKSRREYIEGLLQTNEG